MEDREAVFSFIFVTNAGFYRVLYLPFTEPLVILHSPWFEGLDSSLALQSKILEENLC